MNRERIENAFIEAKEGNDFEHGLSRRPIFGELIRGIWAGKTNPQRDGYYVKTIVRKGRLNPGIWYQLTDKKGRFWQYEATHTLFLSNRPKQTDI